MQPTAGGTFEDGHLKLSPWCVQCQAGKINLDRSCAKARNLSDLGSVTGVGDVKLDKQIPVRPAGNHVRNNGSEPVFEERSVEPVESAGVASRSLTIPVERWKHEGEFGCEQLLGKAVQRGLRSPRAGALARGIVVSEVMAQLLASTSNQRCPAVRTSAVAGKTGGHLGDMDEAAIWSLTEEQPLPRVGLDGTFHHVTSHMDGHVSGASAAGLIHHSSTTWAARCQHAQPFGTTRSDVLGLPRAHRPGGRQPVHAHPDDRSDGREVQNLVLRRSLCCAGTRRRHEELVT